MSPYRLVYGKTCHQPIELEHREYWVIKKFIFSLDKVGGHINLQLNELKEIKSDAYDSAKRYNNQMNVFYEKKSLENLFLLVKRSFYTTFVYIYP